MQSVASMILQHEKSMRKLATRLMRNGPNADDVFQTACLNALRKGAPEHINNPRAWLSGFVANARRDFIRGEARYEEGGDEIAALIPAPANQDHHVDLDALMRRVDALPAKESAAFVSIAVHGNTSREAAVELGYRDNKGALYQYNKACRSLGIAA